MRTNDAKQKMLGGEPALGVSAALTSPWSAEILSNSGYDWVLMDTQHGFWSPDAVRSAVLAILRGSAAPVARVAINDYTLIGRLLDDGLLGIIVPLVNTKAEAEAAAAAMRYPPRGSRSNAGSPITALYGGDYFDGIDNEVFLAVQIESAQAVENADEIFAIEGVDGCWIGPSDLALSMGLKVSDMGGHPAHNEAVAHVLEMCQKHGKIPGYACGSIEMGKRRIAEGFKFVNIGVDATFVADGAAACLAELRA